MARAALALSLQKVAEGAQVKLSAVRGFEKEGSGFHHAVVQIKAFYLRAGFTFLSDSRPGAEGVMVGAGPGEDRRQAAPAAALAAPAGE